MYFSTSLQIKSEEDVENNLLATNFITLCCNAAGKRCSIPTAASHGPLTCAKYGGDCEIDLLALTKIIEIILEFIIVLRSQRMPLNVVSQRC